jgi:hypothetical protein
MTRTVAGAISLILIAGLMAGCSLSPRVWGKQIVKEVYCGTDRNKDGKIAGESEDGLYVPVHLSRSDTDATIEQTLVNNRTYDETCNVTPPRKAAPRDGRLAGSTFSTGGTVR